MANYKNKTTHINILKMFSIAEVKKSIRNLRISLSYFLNRKRRMRNKVIYLETSAVNYLASISSYEDALATRKYHTEMKNKYMISVVTLWEILMTSNENEREKIIFFIQNALYNELIFSPSELIINFINSGCPTFEPTKSIYTKLQIGETWKDICENNQKTLTFDTEVLKNKTKVVRDFFKRIDLAISDISNESSSNNDLKLLADSVYSNLTISQSENIDKDTERIYKLSIIFITTILCAGVEFDNSSIENYWLEKGINDTEQRVAYIFKNHEVLVHRGPFVTMALMAYNQILEDKKPNRGLFWDALHSLYLPYVDYLLTKDRHFKELQKKVSHINFMKIKLIEEETIKWREVKN